MMGNKFFVAFKNKSEEKELKDIITRMNNLSYRYDRSEALKLSIGVFGYHKGFFVERLLLTESYEILWRKYYILSREEDAGVFFYDESLAKKEQEKIRMTALA